MFTCDLENGKMCRAFDAPLICNVETFDMVEVFFKLLFIHSAAFDLLCIAYYVIGKYGYFKRMGAFIGSKIGFCVCYLMHQVHLRYDDQNGIVYFEHALANFVQKNKWFRRAYFLSVALSFLVLSTSIAVCLLHVPFFWNLSVCSHFIICVFCCVTFAIQVGNRLGRSLTQRGQSRYSYCTQFYRSMTRNFARLVKNTSCQRNMLILKFAILTEMMSYDYTTDALTDQRNALPKAMNDIIVDYLYQPKIKQLCIENLVFVFFKIPLDDDEDILCEILEFVFGDTVYETVTFCMWYHVCKPFSMLYQATIEMNMDKHIPMTISTKRALAPYRHRKWMRRSVEYDPTSKVFVPCTCFRCKLKTGW